MDKKREFNKNGSINAHRRMGRDAFACLLMLAGMAAVTVYAAEDDTGYYGQTYESGTAPAAATDTTGEAEQVWEMARRDRYVAPDAGGLVYQPGFHGCAPSIRAGSISGWGGDLMAPPPLPAGDYDRFLRFGLTVGETYTDNVELARSGEAESAWVTQVVPSVEACANTGRIKASADYRMQALYYASGDQADKIYHHGAGATTIEALPGHLFIAADTSYGQSVINPSAVYSRSNILRPGNRTSTWRTNISPYWFQDLGRIGQGTLRYRYGRTEYGRESLPDYSLNGVHLNVSSPPANPVWSYQFNAASQRVRRSGGERLFYPGTNIPVDDRGNVTHYDSAALQLGYQLTDSLQLLAMGGREDKYEPDGSNDRFGSTVWNAGFRWTSPTNALEMRYGHRFFGSTFMARATHHGPNFDVALSYDENITGAGLDQLNYNGGISWPSSYVGGLLGTLEDRGVYRRKRLLTSLSFDTARTRTTWRIYDEERKFITADIADEDIYGTSLHVSYQLGPRTRLIPRVGWEYRKTEQSRTQTGEAGVGALYQLTPSSQLGFGYSHAWRNNKEGSHGYDENRITAQYSVYF
ncbi:MAG TPA: TIGR03016 family PEP-CTERM system-associated outer membrane protein [Salinisphaeraceae bacterium]|nr:TIGR03016 family PEP-CTERM system-associated outer membrane protein [Salinisphaeraceae bacterium]